jgi:uncharacterized protein
MLLQISLEMGPLLYVVLILLGLLIGTFATLGGVGGGVIIMPILLLWLGIAPETAKGTSLLVICFSSGLATFIHYRNGKIKPLSSLITAIFAILGSVLMNYLQTMLIIEKSIFYLIFGIFEVLIGIRLLGKFRKEYTKNKLEKKNQNPNLNPMLNESENDFSIENFDLIKNPKLILKAAPLFFISGMLVTFFGIGGGVVNTPTFLGIMHFPIHFATANSSAIIFFTSLYNSIGFGLRGEINWIVGVIMGIGMVLGARIGAKFSSKVPRHYILGILSLLLFLASIQMILKA